MDNVFYLATKSSSSSDRRSAAIACFFPFTGDGRGRSDYCAVKADIRKKDYRNGKAKATYISSSSACSSARVGEGFFLKETRCLGESLAFLLLWLLFWWDMLSSSINRSLLSFSLKL